MPFFLAPVGRLPAMLPGRTLPKGVSDPSSHGGCAAQRTVGLDEGVREVVERDGGAVVFAAP